ncbi:MAG: hypothetical protein ABR579_03535, partial [Actinomycetota bacterium]
MPSGAVTLEPLKDVNATTSPRADVPTLGITTDVPDAVAVDQACTGFVASTPEYDAIPPAAPDAYDKLTVYVAGSEPSATFEKTLARLNAASVVDVTVAHPAGGVMLVAVASGRNETSCPIHAPGVVELAVRVPVDPDVVTFSSADSDETVDELSV